MERKRLGSSGVMVPEIGLGTWRYTGGPEPLRRGIELGANLIDTAEMYRTEDAVGEAIAGIRRPGVRRHQGPGQQPALRRRPPRRRPEAYACSPLTRLTSTRSTGLTPVFPSPKPCRPCNDWLTTAWWTYVGVSNFSVEDMAEAQAAMPHHPIVSNQILYNLRRRRAERDVIPYCRQHDIAVIAYSPLHEGALTGNGGGVASGVRRALGMNRDRQVLADLAGETGKTAAQVALNWVADQPGVIAIPKSNSVARTEENCAASGWSLTPDQRQRLDAVFPV